MSVLGQLLVFFIHFYSSAIPIAVSPNVNFLPLEKTRFSDMSSTCTRNSS